MRLAMVLGATLLFAPAAFAHGNKDLGNQNSNSQSSQNLNSDQSQSDQSATIKRFLPSDAKLVGAVESTDVREFPDQASQRSKVAKEDLVGVGALDRMYSTQKSYRQTVQKFDQSLKGEGIQPIAKTITQSSTAYNVRMPDGHIANVVIRNTQPTTIESVSAAAVEGTLPGTSPNQMNQNQNLPNQNLNQNQPSRSYNPPSNLPSSKSGSDYNNLNNNLNNK